jgi:hypothetical protein
MRLVKHLFLVVAFLALGLLAGCGGGGGGGGGSVSNTVRGIVKNSLDSDKGAAGVPVTIGGVTATTRTRDNADANHPVGFFEMQNVTVGVRTATIKLSDTVTQTVAFAKPVTSGVNTDLELFVNIGQVYGQVLLPDNKTGASGAFVTIISSDKDLMQLVVDGQVELLDPVKQKPIRSAEVLEKFGVLPNKVVDVQALAGDASVRPVDDTIEPAVLGALVSRSGGEAISR